MREIGCPLAAASPAARDGGRLAIPHKWRHIPGMPEPLREAINEAVEKYPERRLEAGGPIDVAAIAGEMARSIVDMIMEQDDQHQGPLLPRQSQT
jgi:hypothetical protein